MTKLKPSTVVVSKRTMVAVCFTLRLLYRTTPAIALPYSTPTVLWWAIENNLENQVIEAQLEEGDEPTSYSHSAPREVEQLIGKPSVGFCGEEDDSEVCARSNETRLIIER